MYVPYHKGTYNLFQLIKIIDITRFKQKKIHFHRQDSYYFKS